MKRILPLSGLIVLGVLASALLSCTTTESQIHTKTSSSFSFTYAVEVNDIPASAQRVDIYLPLPNDNGYQTISDISAETDMKQETIVDPDFGNKILHLWQDSVNSDSKSATVRMSVTRESADALDADKTTGEPVNRRFLRPNRLVPIDGEIAVEADSFWQADKSNLSNVRAIYDHLFETMKYDKSGSGWGNGDAVRACNVRSGNCTDIHSLFIGMLRSKGIPARFIIGFPLPEKKDSGEIGGYHCWAEFYDEDRGWIPIDLSDAINFPDKKDFFFGKLDADRVAFSTGRDITLDTTITEGVANFFIYPYVLVDGKRFSGAKTTFSFERMGS